MCNVSLVTFVDLKFIFVFGSEVRFLIACRQMFFQPTNMCLWMRDYPFTACPVTNEDLCHCAACSLQLLFLLYPTRKSHFLLCIFCSCYLSLLESCLVFWSYNILLGIWIHTSNIQEFVFFIPSPFQLLISQSFVFILCVSKKYMFLICQFLRLCRKQNMELKPHQLL